MIAGAQVVNLCTCTCEGPHMADGGNVVILKRPPHMYPTQRGDTIEVDRCIAPLVEHLWSLGVWTAGACCGHQRVRPSVCVFPEHEEAMAGLGYERMPPPYNGGGGCFYVG